ncbi:MAG TPA: ABC transporter ATP-binding protein [Bacilli bacterium]|nr:ABC transporter ATP-binding protein [Bacilli bacterium]
MILLKHFRQYYLIYLWAFLPGILILAGIDYLQLEIPRVIGGIIDGVDKGEITAIGQIERELLYLLIIVLIMTVGRFLWRFLLFGTGRRIETDVRREMFFHATRLDQAYYTNQKIGGLMSYFINDLNAVRELFGRGTLMIVDGLFLGAFVLIRMFSLNPIMTGYALIPIGLMGVLVFFLSKKIELKSKIRQEAFEHTSDFAQESFTGITVIKAYVREAAESLGFKKKSQDVYNKSMDFMKYVIVINVIIDALISLVILAIIAYGAILIGYGDLTSGQLTEYISYFFSLLWPVFAISMFLNLNGQAQASAKRIYEFLESKALVVEHKDALKDVQLDGSIRAVNLTFTYPDSDTPILQELNFDIKAGEMVGILGRTGSGKSTLVELLLHVYNTEEGMLYFGEYDIASLSIKTLRAHMGYVPQDNFLYSDTIENNIGFAFESIEQDRLIEVAKLADIHENVIEFKHQYQTLLGERGVTVSGGQKQRISIARALAKDPKILILDDSVSAVDTKTEEAIISNLRKVRTGKTTLMIAHRISTVKKLDKIILLEEGRLIGFGSHEELLASNSVYQDMVKRQELEALVGEVSDHA